MLTPSKTKYRKSQKGGKKIKGNATSGDKISYGSFALKSLDSGKINSRQIEAARKVITRYMKRKGKFWIRVFPHTPITRKPAEVRMGSGKGSVEFYAMNIKPGKIIFEVDGVPDDIAIQALEKSSGKLPFKVRVVQRVY
jgi:large subunit ribosomal protein L16